MKNILLILLITLSATLTAQQSFQLPSIISNHAVLQQQSEVKLWGWGPINSNVSIVCGWNKADTIITKIKTDFTWQVTVKTPKAGESYSIEFLCDKAKLKIDDIIMGEVWLFTGQSNMGAFWKGSMALTDGGDAFKTCKNSNIRFFRVNQAVDKYPQKNCNGVWQLCDTISLVNFSTIGYFFGKNINSTLNVPVGLIQSQKGGTCIQPWTPIEVIENNPVQKKISEQIQLQNHSPIAPSLLYNAMIYPLTPYKIAGVVWYQGESNVIADNETNQLSHYGESVVGLINSWRKVFENEFPFYSVQIAPFNGYKGIDAALLREQQASILALPKTGLVCVSDLVGDISNIHPTIKAEVANRLSNMALKEQYNQKDLQPYSPKFLSLKIDKNQAIIAVQSVGKLNIKGKEILNFQLAGQDKVFYPATAKLQKNGTITVNAANVTEPVAVRYCFTNDAIPNLFDTNGLPLLPFRTDDWK
jgi:sialate O-acetylesterase